MESQLKQLELMQIKLFQEQEKIKQQIETLIIKPADTTDYYSKADLLRKLYMLNKAGVKLRKVYNLNSSYDDMMFEYLLHTNPEKLQVG